MILFRADSKVAVMSNSEKKDIKIKHIYIPPLDNDEEDSHAVKQPQAIDFKQDEFFDRYEPIRELDTL